MNSTNSRTILLKKMMAVAGLIWFVYLIFHMVSVLSFHSGEEVFSGFYVWLNSSIFYPILLALLVLTISFHVVIAVSRQLSNNESVGERYKKAYPKAIPRLVAWLGASIMLAFIIIHSVQMLTRFVRISCWMSDLWAPLKIQFSRSTTGPPQKSGPLNGG